MKAWHSLLADRLAKKYRSTGPGHVTRLNGLSLADARDLCALLKDALGEARWNVAVIASSQGTGAPTDITMDQAIERRNDKSKSRFFLVPQGVVAEAAASLADTEWQDVTDHLLVLLREVLKSFSPDLRLVLESATKGAKPSTSLEYLSAVQEDPTPTTAGLELWRIGLIPDLSPTPERVVRNRATLAMLADHRLAAGSAHARVAAVEVGPADLASRLTKRLRASDALGPEWLRAIGAETGHSVTFDKWIFPETEGDLRSIDVLPYVDTRRQRAQAWTGLQLEAGSLKAYVGSKSDRVVTRWTTDPPEPSTIPTYEVILETCDPEPVQLLSSLTRHRKANYQSWTFQPAESQILNEGSVRVRVVVRSVQDPSVELAISSEFLLVADEVAPSQPTTFSVTRSLADFQFERADDRQSAELTSISVDETDGVRIEIGGRHRKRVSLAPVLFGAERGQLVDPFVVSHELPAMTEGRWEAHHLVPQLASADLREALSDEWWRGRRKTYAWISDNGQIVEGAHLHPIKDGILTLARGYANALERAMSATGQKSRPSVVDELLAIDSIQVVQDSKIVAVLLSPLHPLRLLWHLSHEMLLEAWAAAYSVKVPGSARTLVQSLDGSFSPAFISFGGRLLGAADSPQFHWPLYIDRSDASPSSVNARIARGLGMGSASTLDWVGTDSTPIATRLTEYLGLHGHVGTLKLDIVNPAEGRLVLGALSQVDRVYGTDGIPSAGVSAYELRLFGEPPLGQLGSLLDDAANSRRGATMLPESIEALFRPSGSYLRPHISWSKRSVADLYRADSADRGSHVALAIDVFGEKALLMPELAVPLGDDTAAHGLIVQPSDHPLQEGPGTFSTVRIPAETSSEPHPADRALSRDLLRTHRTMLRATAFAMGRQHDTWPARTVAISDQQVALFDQLHERADWVIAADANVPIDFFDSPNASSARLRENAARYVIDYAPATAGSRRVMVSTAWVDELRGVLRDTLKQMAITPTDLAYEDILRLLKSVSGRIVMRLARDPANAKEVVSLAITREVLRGEGVLDDAFLIPIDDHQGVLVDPGDDGPARRADLLMVRVPSERSRDLECTVIEVKFRRHAHMARDAALAADMAEAVGASVASLQRRFFPSEPSRSPHWVIARAELRGLLEFYGRRAARHGLLSEESSGRLEAVLGRLQSSDLTLTTKRRGFVYCPDLVRDLEEVERPGIVVTLVGQAALTRFTTLHPSTPRPSAEVQQGLEPPWDGDRKPTMALASSPNRSPADDDSSAPSDGNVVAGDAVANPAAPQSETQSSVAQPTDLDQPPAISETPTADVASAKVEREPGREGGSIGDSPPIAQLLSSSEVSDESGRHQIGSHSPEIEPTQERPVTAILLGHEPRTEDDVVYRPSIRANPHLLLVGIPGMGKTTALLNICRELAQDRVFPFVIDFHGDIAAALLRSNLREQVKILDASTGVPFNPLEVDPLRRAESNGWKVQVHELAEIIGDIYPSFGELQVGQLREAIRSAYDQVGFARAPLTAIAPPFNAIWDTLREAAEERSDVRKILTRLESIFDLGLFSSQTASQFATLSDLLGNITVLDLHRVPIEENQRVAASFFLHRLYRAMFATGQADRLTTAIVFDEAHRVAKLRLLPRMMQESRKFGVAMLVSSQRVEDFDQGVLDSAGNHLYLRLNSPDAKRLAAYLGMPGRSAADAAAKLQSLSRYRGLFRSEDYQPFIEVALLPLHGSN